jgi:hypothetical protein
MQCKMELGSSGFGVLFLSDMFLPLYFYICKREKSESLKFFKIKNVYIQPSIHNWRHVTLWCVKRPQKSGPVSLAANLVKEKPDCPRCCLPKSARDGEYFFVLFLRIKFLHLRYS